MPGDEVKDWKMYEALRREGHSKQSAARITNAHVKRSNAAKKGHQTRRSKKGA